MLDKIKRACALANNVDYVNNGGCCVFASLLGRKLLDMGIPCWGVAAYSEAWSDEPNVPVWEARKNVQSPSDPQEWNDNGINFDHVGIRFKLYGKYYQADSTGVTKVKQELGTHHPNYPYKVGKGRFTIAELESFARARYYWNDLFDRRRGIHKLKRAIKESFA